jgi:protein-S-isoprenylcysteine O-methyltransferase Ste14
LVLAYRIACYLGFVASFGYAVLFLAGVAVPRTVDHGGPAAGWVAAVVVDALLLALVAVQHSVMARPGFKRVWTLLVPRAVERSTYVLASTLALALVLWQWRPVPAVVWDITTPAVRVVLWALFATGWVWVLAMSFAIDHLDLFGLRQRVKVFRLPWPYRLVRQPMMLGFFPAFLAVPTMTAGHLLFAVLGCGYILVGVRLEERDLAAELPEYRSYAATTGRFLPRRVRQAPVAG